MSKVVIQTVASLEDESTALGKINQNFTDSGNQIEAQFSRTGLNADGTPVADNTLHTTLDVNNNRIINLPAPISYTEPARHGELQVYVDEASASAAAALVSETNAAASAAASAASATASQASLDAFEGVWQGELASEPALDLNGNPFTGGELYFDSTLHAMRVFDVQRVFVDTDEVFVGTDNVVTSQWKTLPSNLLATLQDVELTGLVNKSLLQWNSALQLWKPITLDLISIDFAAYLPGTPTVSVAAFKFIMAEDVDFADDFSGSFAKLGTGPTGGSVVFDVQKNGVSVGSITFSAGATSGTLATSGTTVSFIAGDLLSVISPSDLRTCADLAVTFKGTLVV